MKRNDMERNTKVRWYCVLAWTFYYLGHWASLTFVGKYAPLWGAYQWLMGKSIDYNDRAHCDVWGEPDEHVDEFRDVGEENRDA